MKQFLYSLAIGVMTMTAMPVQADQPAGNIGAQTDLAHSGERGYSDPIEPVNRFFFGFNRLSNEYVLHPAVEGYRFVVPYQGRKVISNFVRNLRSPENFANHLLQGDLKGAGHVLFRFTVNTLTGFGGLLDVAEWEGYKHHEEDFGQTLAVWGVGDGPYLVMPIFGPASLRDGVGYATDAYANPFARYADNTDDAALENQLSGLAFLTQRNALKDFQKDVYQNSVDPYVRMRNIVFQRRQAQIQDNGRVTEESAQPAIPSYDF